MHRLTKRVLAACVVGGLALSAVACSPETNKKETRSESATRDKSYRQQVAADPAHTMTYSPTRKTINKWIDTWSQRGQLAFTYILNQNGDKVGYFVFEGPPVSMCASIAPPWRYEGTPNDGSDTLDQRVPAPSLDGVYHSGGQCLSYYGIDAATGKYLEFSIGGTQNYITATQPLDLSVPPLGYTKVTDLKKEGEKYVAP